MISKIVVIGNTAGGKTLLSRQLAKLHHLPLTHVDSLQFLPGLQMRPHQETKLLLDQIINKDAWLIDGYGPLDSLEARFERADHIIFIDLPLWRHYWWIIKRQIKNIFYPRTELPPGCNELTWTHTKKIFRTTRNMHYQMRPELLRILNRKHFASKLIIINDLKTWKQIYSEGVSELKPV